jgi:uncharacterized protein
MAMSLQAQAEQFFAQKRIAVVGVSREAGTGNSIFKALRGRGLDVVPINPKASEIEGRPCYPTVQSVPGGVGAAVIVTRPEVTETVVRDCAAAGVSHVWMHYNPMFGAGNSSVSDAAVAYCRQQGISVIDGACPLMFGQGADFPHRCMRWILARFGRLPAGARDRAKLDST